MDQQKNQPRVEFYIGLQLSRRLSDAETGTVDGGTNGRVAIAWPSSRCSWDQYYLLQEIRDGRITVEPAVGMRLQNQAGGIGEVLAVLRCTGALEISWGGRKAVCQREDFDLHIRTGAWAILPPEQPAASYDDSDLPPDLAVQMRALMGEQAAATRLGSAGTSRTWELDGWRYRVEFLADLTDEEAAYVERVVYGLPKQKMVVKIVLASDGISEGDGLEFCWRDSGAEPVVECYMRCGRQQRVISDMSRQLPSKPMRIDARRAAGEADAPVAEPTSDDLSIAIDARRLELLSACDILSPEARDACRAGAERIRALQAELLIERAERVKAQDSAAAERAAIQLHLGDLHEVERRRDAAERERDELRERLELQSLKSEDVCERARHTEYALRDEIRRIEHERDAAIARADNLQAELSKHGAAVDSLRQQLSGAEKECTAGCVTVARALQDVDRLERRIARTDGLLDAAINIVLEHAARADEAEAELQRQRRGDAHASEVLRKAAEPQPCLIYQTLTVGSGIQALDGRGPVDVTTKNGNLVTRNGHADLRVTFDAGGGS